METLAYLIAAYVIYDMVSKPIKKFKRWWNENIDPGQDIISQDYEEEAVEKGQLRLKLIATLHLILEEERLRIEEEEEEERLIKIAGSTVETFPKSYQGRIPKPRLNKVIETDYWNSWEDAMDELCLIAYKNNCQYVIMVERLSKRFEYNHYYRNGWKYKGII